MSLIESLERQYQNNEQTLASSIAVPKLDLDAELINRFVRFAKERGVRYCPAAPAVVATYVCYLHDHGTPQDAILQSLEAIEVAHSQLGLANPVATPVVREQLGCVLQIQAPRSWPANDKNKFYSLPVDIQQVILKREQQDTKTLRLLHNELADLRKTNQKGTNDHE